MADMGYQVFVATDGTALEGGFIYLGLPDSDPETTPIPVYWNAALTVPAAQPLRTSGGVIVRDGAPADVFAARQSYSIRVRDRSGSLVWYKPVTGGDVNATRLTFPIPAGPASDVPGPADNTYADLVSFKASDIARKTASLVGVVGVADGRFNWTLGDFTGQADDQNIIKANSTALSTGAWVRQGAKGVAYGRAVNIALPLDKSLPRTLAWLSGIDPFATVSQQSKLEAAFTAAAGEGYKLVTGHADANYRRDGKLTINGFSFDGQGATFTAMSDGQQEFRVIGDGPAVRNLRSLGAGTSRSDDNSKNGFTFGADAPISNFIAENLFVGSVDLDGTRGHQTCGFYFGKATNGRIINCGGFASRADGFHVTDGSKDLRFQLPYMRRAGDDSFAVVSYRSQGGICERIGFWGAQSVDGRSRAGAVVGGRDVVFYALTAVGSSAAVIYFAREASFDTYGTFNARALDFVARNCVTGIGLPAGFQNALIILTGNAGSDIVDGASVDQAARDCIVRGEVQGVGAACSGLIDVNSKYAIKPVVQLRGRDAIGSTLAPYGIGMGGTNADIELAVDNLGGLPIISSPDLTGIARAKVTGSGVRTQGLGPNTNFFAVAANDLVELNLEMVVDNAPSQFLLNTGLNGTKIRRKGIRVNGNRLGDIDYVAAGITYTGTSYVMTVPLESGQIVTPYIPLQSNESIKIIVSDRHRVELMLQAMRSDVANGDNYLKLAETWEYENTTGTGVSGADFIARTGGGVYQRRRDVFPGNGAAGIRGTAPLNVAMAYASGQVTFTLTPAGAYPVEVGAVLNTIYRSIS